MASTPTPKQNKQNLLLFHKGKQRIFIDSSVLIAAAISAIGSARELINRGIAQEIDLYLSSDVVEETERNLKRKAPEGLTYFYEIYESSSFLQVKPTKIQIFKAAKIVIGKDAPIVAGAIAAKADFLVSYDRKHLLSYTQEIEENFKINVVTPDELKKGQR